MECYCKDSKQSKIAWGHSLGAAPVSRNSIGLVNAVGGFSAAALSNNYYQTHHAFFDKSTKIGTQIPTKHFWIRRHLQLFVSTLAIAAICRPSNSHRFSLAYLGVAGIKLSNSLQTRHLPSITSRQVHEQFSESVEHHTVKTATQRFCLLNRLTWSGP